MTSAGDADGFVARLVDAGSTGSFAWTQRLGGPGYDEASALFASGAAVYVAGSFSGAATFGATTLNSSGYTDVFITRLTDAGNTGNFLWAQQAGGMNGDYATSVTLTSNGNTYVGGTVASPAFFGNQVVAGPANGAEVGFIASLTDPTLTATTAALRPENTDLFPNPAHGRATIQLPALPGAPTATLTISTPWAGPSAPKRPRPV